MASTPVSTAAVRAQARGTPASPVSVFPHLPPSTPSSSQQHQPRLQADRSPLREGRAGVAWPVVQRAEFASQPPKSRRAIFCSAGRGEQTVAAAAAAIAVDSAVWEAAYRAGYEAALADARATSAAATAASSNAAPGEPAGDSLARSAVKSIGWRLFSTVATMAVLLGMFGGQVQVEDALKFGSAEFVAKLLVYMAYERIWAKVTLLR